MTLVGGPSRPEIPALTGLRGVLALWIVLLHIAIGLEQLGQSIAGRLGQVTANLVFTGTLAVDGFFVLSGFVLSYAHAQDFGTALRAGPLLRFWGLRLGRIWPVHGVVLALYAIAAWGGVQWLTEACGNPANRVGPCDRFSFSGLMEQLLLVQAWGVDRTVGWNFVAWSISSEWFVYLWFPLICLAACRIGPIVAGIGAGLAMVAVVIVVPQIVPQFQGVNDDYGLARAIPEFLAGCLLYRVYALEAFSAQTAGLLAGASLAALVGLLALAVLPQMSSLALAMLVAALASGPHGVIARALSSPPVLWLGRISYSLYMSHVLVIELMGFVMRSFIRGNVMRLDIQLVGVIALLIGLTLAAGWMLNRLVEEPARRWVRQRLARG
jgi:peptidoglycan/LPS O-acetylase OafA/YrhL